MRAGRGRRVPRRLRVCALSLGAPPMGRAASLGAVREHVLARLVAVARGRPDLIVLPAYAGLLPALAMPGGGDLSMPELASRLGPPAADVWLDWCRSWARTLDVALCTGGAVTLRGGELRHACWLVDRGGAILLEQLQTHVDPDDAVAGLAPGDELAVATLGGVRAGVALGLDARYPEVGRILALQGAELLLCPVALPAPVSDWDQRAGVWAQVQGNQVFAVESCLAGTLGGRSFGGRSACLAPVELSPGGDGTLAVTDGEGGAVAVFDPDRLHELRRDYPIVRHLNPALYLRRLLPAYARAGARGGAVP